MRGPPGGEWRNWQTRRIQVPVGSRSWGFESPLAHPVSYSPTGRRRKRRRTLIVSAVVLGLIALAFGITQAEGEREVTRSYLDVVFDVVSDEAAMAAGFFEMISEIEEYQRARMIQSLDDLEEVGGSSLDRLVAAEPPASLVGGHQWLMLAVSSWRAGLSETRAGLLALSSNPVDEEGLAAVWRGVFDLRVGDRAYRGFVSAMAGVDTAQHGGSLPSIAFIPAGQEALFDPTSLARRLLLAPGLGPVDDLAVADLRLDPSAVGTRGGLPVLPVASIQRIEATIANRGNIDRIEIPVTLRLISDTGLLHEEVLMISELKAGDLTALAFSPLPVSPGTTYELTISVPEGDTEPDNDSRSVTFVVNPDG
jgi:hypothetical protein